MNRTGVMKKSGAANKTGVMKKAALVMLSGLLAAAMTAAMLPQQAQAAASGAQQLDRIDPASLSQSVKTTSPEPNPAGGAVRIASSSARVRGLDVSSWGGALNYRKIKARGYKFVIVRVAYAGMGTGALHTDKYFKRNIKQAHKYGLKIGAYVFSQATTPAEAKREARYVTARLKPYKSWINLPICCDMESPISMDGWTTYWGKRYHRGYCSKAKNVRTYRGFSSAVKKAGYRPMFYSYTYWINDHISMKRLKACGDPLWLAEYNRSGSPRHWKKLYPHYRYEFWQYAGTTRVDGSHTADLNYWYTKDLNKYADFRGRTAITEKTAKTSSISLRWKKVRGATKYQVEYKKSHGRWKKHRTSSTRTTLRRLKSDTKYSLRVLAMKKSDKGRYSRTKSIRTAKKKLPAPGAVTGIRYTSTEKSVTLKWKKASRATEYVVYLKDGKGSYRALKSGVKKTSFTEKLNAYGQGQWYIVQAVNKEGSSVSFGALSEPVYAHAALPYRAKDSGGTLMTSIDRYTDVYYCNEGETRQVGQVQCTGVTKKKTTVYKSASSKSRRIGIVRAGKRVRLTKIEDGWYRIQYGKLKGYVLHEALR